MSRSLAPIAPHVVAKPSPRWQLLLFRPWRAADFAVFRQPLAAGMIGL